MSSRDLEVELRPDPGLRVMPLLFAVLAWVVGILLVFRIDIHFGWRCLLVTVWTADVGAATRRLLRGQRRVARLLLGSGGTLLAVRPDGRREPLTLLGGSVVYRRVAWLRFRFADGCRHAELLCGDASRDPEWHCLQLIWRLGRDAFGHMVRP